MQATVNQHVPTIAGYRELELIGEGDRGRVYRARHESTGGFFAVKMFSAGLGQVSGLDHRAAPLRRELALCRGLRHPNIVRLIDQGQVGDEPYAIFEYVVGETLQTTIQTLGPLTPLQARDVMAQVLGALTKAHRVGVMHGDLKPNNIMVTRSGCRLSVKVLDFGTGALLRQARTGDYSSILSSWATPGTAAYCSPEQLRGESVTERSDLYSWGLVFLECLTGQRALRGATAAEQLYANLTPGQVPLPSFIQRHPLGELLRSALRKNVRWRAASAEKLLSQLEELDLGDLEERLPDSSRGPELDESSIPPTVRGGELGVLDRRQVTSLSCSLHLSPSGASIPEPEALGAILGDQLAGCLECCAEFGGDVAGVLGNRFIVHFGCRQASELATRLALRTAIVVCAHVARRSARLEARQGVRLEVRLGLDTGMALVHRDGSVAGLTASAASVLEQHGPPGQITVSEATRRAAHRQAHFIAQGSELLPTSPMVEAVYSLVELISADLSSGSLSEGALIGRDEELQTFGSHLAAPLDVAGNRAPHCLIVGEAGVGKSRLLREFSIAAREHGFRTLKCRCLPEHGNTCLWPILTLLREHLTLAPDGSNLVERLEQLALPDLAARVPVVSAWLEMPCPKGFVQPPYSPGRQRELLFETLVFMLRALGNNQPVWLAVEDLHWSDPSTLELLARLTNATPTSIVISATCRSPGDQQLGAAARTVDLERFSAAMTEKLVRQLVNSDQLAQLDVASLHQHCQGIPLFVEEYVRMGLERRTLADRPSEPMATSLRGLLIEKLETAGASAATICLAATLGYEFDGNALLSISSRSVGDVFADLDKMCSAGLVHYERRGPNFRCSFRHALMRDAAYESMPAEVRRRTHGQVASYLAQQLEQGQPVQASVVAYHLAAARQFPQAVRFGLLAAKQALKRGANQECIATSKLVLEWLQRLKSAAAAEAELAINQTLCQAYIACEGWVGPNVRETVHRSHRLLRTTTRPQFEGSALWTLAAYHHTASNRSEYRKVVSSLRTLALAQADLPMEVAAQALYSSGLWCDGQSQRAMEAATSAALRAEELGPVDPARFGFDCGVFAYASRGAIAPFVTTPARARQDAQLALRKARSRDHLPTLCIALLHSGLAMAALGDKEATRDYCEELLGHAEQFGLSGYVGYGALLHGWSVGDHSRRDAIVSRLTAAGCRLGLPFYTSLLAESHAEHGRSEDALHVINESLRLSDETKERYYVPELYTLRGVYQEALYGAGAPAAIDSFQTAARLAATYQNAATEYRALRHLNASGVVELTCRAQHLQVHHPELFSEMA